MTKNFYCMVCGGPSPCETHTFHGYLNDPPAKRQMTGFKIAFGCPIGMIPICEIRQVDPEMFSADISFVPKVER